VAARRTTDGEVWTTLGALQLSPQAADGAAAGSDGGACVVRGGHVEQPTALADVLELLDSRHFRLLGRANDLIHVAGKRSSLAHLNFQLNRIEGVQDGAFWMPAEAPDGVTRPLAFVVAPGLTAAQVIQGLRDRLEAAFVPRRVVHVEALPREATGKLTTQALADFARTTLAGPPDTEFVIAHDHPAFAGHFPGHPVLPGVVLLSAMLQALAGQRALQRRVGLQPTIEQVKFLAPVGPGARVKVALHEQGADRVAFELRERDRVVARGVLAPGHGP
jgi:3-hydroxymyristoyl/3-hydroxydecanoyl-(acyl carrier protein) dehydratase